MPDRLVGAERTDRLSVLDDVGNDGNVAAPLLDRVDIAVFALEFDARGGDDRRPVELSEMGAELHQLIVIEALAAKAQHEIVRPGLLDRFDSLRRKVLREIDTVDICPKRRTRRPHLDLLPFQNR